MGAVVLLLEENPTLTPSISSQKRGCSFLLLEENSTLIPSNVSQERGCSDLTTGKNVTFPPKHIFPKKCAVILFLEEIAIPIPRTNSKQRVPKT